MLADLKRSGCRFKVSGNRFTISDIPDWQTYQSIQDNLKKLILIVVTGHVFREPLKPIKFDEKRDSKCPHCKNYNSVRCPYKLNSYHIPPGTFEKGCELWAESKSIYF